MPNYPFTDEVVEKLLKKFDLKNPNNGEVLTIEEFNYHYKRSGMDKRLTLISLTGVSERKGMLPKGTGVKLKKAMKDYDG